jgi:hypothetical protein
MRPPSWLVINWHLSCRGSNPRTPRTLCLLFKLTRWTAIQLDLFFVDYDYNSNFWTSGRYTQKSKQWTWTGSAKPVQNINFVKWDPEGGKKDTQKDYAIMITSYGHEWISAAIDPQWTSQYICEKAIDPTLFPKWFVGLQETTHSINALKLTNAIVILPLTADTKGSF